MPVCLSPEQLKLLAEYAKKKGMTNYKLFLICTSTIPSFSLRFVRQTVVKLTSFERQEPVETPSDVGQIAIN